ncbi:hypothetical protein INT43_000098 [Umbelopsis isabellina]|uniref:AAA+ ATPase domain-containing protein n=1 Tax=Mortierella isabellina TaxID=91625 RepID=A0A8H7PF25_MORIS|nr:hypothetical protein INT43_000098 [Umbelopsis isabellina]
MPVPPCKEWCASVQQDMGGVDDLVKDIVNQISVLDRFGTQQPRTQGLRGKGTMLIGKPGTGKTALAAAIASQLKEKRDEVLDINSLVCIIAECSSLPYEVVNCPDVFRAEEGASEAIISRAFRGRASNKLSILILDEVDMIASHVAIKKAGVEARTFSVLVDELDRINRPTSSHQIYVIGEVAQITHSFVPADLQNLCRQVVLMLVQQDASCADSTKQSFAQLHHFESALEFIKPSNFVEYKSQLPNIRFKDLFGIDNIIQQLKVSIIDPFRDRSSYLRLSITPPRGLLIHGPPGVGKTALCCALGSEMGINFMLVEGSQVRSKIVGESEKNVAKMFSQARANSPCILFIDQLDALVPKRGTSSSSENTSDRIVTGFLTELDGFFTKSSAGDPSNDVLIVAATNRPQVIDPAIIRPGRIDEHISIPIPGALERKEILQGLSANIPMSIGADDLAQLAERLEGWTGSDIDNLCREAALIALREDIESDKVLLKHMIQAIEVDRPAMVR